MCAFVCVMAARSCASIILSKAGVPGLWKCRIRRLGVGVGGEGSTRGHNKAEVDEKWEREWGVGWLIPLEHTSPPPRPSPCPTSQSAEGSLPSPLFLLLLLRMSRISTTLPRHHITISVPHSLLSPFHLPLLFTNLTPPT